MQMYIEIFSFYARSNKKSRPAEIAHLFTKLVAHKLLN